MSQVEPLKIFHPFHVNDLKRLGNDYDGGYVVHAPSFHLADMLVTYGVGYNIAFEQDFFFLTGKPTLAFDPTLTDLRFVFNELKMGPIPFLRHARNFFIWKFKSKRLPKYHIEFIEEGLSDKDSKDYKSLRYHYEKHNLFDKKIILKMDIEGSEYLIFNDSSNYDLLSNTVQVVLEVHLISQNIEKLIDIMNDLSNTHSLIHIHANNHAGTFNYLGKNVPEAMEMTFLLNSLIPQKQYSQGSYPIAGLDQPCDRLQKDIFLDFFR